MNVQGCISQDYKYLFVLKGYHLWCRGSAKESFGVPDSPKTNLDPLFQKLVPARGSLRTRISNVVLTWTKAGLNQSLLSTPKLPFYEHFDCLCLSPLYPGWDLNISFGTPYFSFFLLGRGSIGTPELFDSVLPLL